jgi:hypothetical protein
MTALIHIQTRYSFMAEHQHSASSDTEQYRDGATSGRPYLGGGIEPWGDGLRMIAVRTERTAIAIGSTEAARYLPTVPADSEEPALD